MVFFETLRECVLDEDLSAGDAISRLDAALKDATEAHANKGSEEKRLEREVRKNKKKKREEEDDAPETQKAIKELARSLKSYKKKRKYEEDE
jgi:seryl-tRNA synthetase